MAEGQRTKDFTLLSLETTGLLDGEAKQTFNLTWNNRSFGFVFSIDYTLGRLFIVKIYCKPVFQK